MGLFEGCGKAGVVCFKCGISGPTLRKWLRCYHRTVTIGLADKSHPPSSSPGRKVTLELETLILRIRWDRRAGTKMIPSEPLRLHGISLSSARINFEEFYRMVDVAVMIYTTCCTNGSTVTIGSGHIAPTAAGCRLTDGQNSWRKFLFRKRSSIHSIHRGKEPKTRIAPRIFCFENQSNSCLPYT
jgi:hypothetical protein